MSPKILFKSIAGIISLTTILACSLINTPVTQTSPALPVAPSQAQSGIPFFASPIRLIIPDGLAASASVEMIDVATDQSAAPWDIAPAHIQLTLRDYPSNGSFHVPQIFVYPTQEYAAANPAAAESIKSLQAILAKPDAAYSNDALPHVPFFNAGQVFASQEKVIQFKNGSGLRIVTQYAQDISPINNSGLFYLFEGLSGDGKYYIVAVLPLNLPFLPADNNPNSATPAGGIAFPQNGAPGASFESYYKSITDLINNTASDQFKPSLTQLDELIQSINFTAQ